MHLVDGVLLVLPLGFLAVEAVAEFGHLFLQSGQTLLRKFIRFLFQRGFLNLQLGDAVVHLVQFGGHRIQLGLDHGAGFIHQVDSLIGQETVGDIAVGQGGCCNQRSVLNLDAVEHFVPLFQATQDGDGVLHRRLVDHNGLKTTFQRRVFLDVLAVLIQRGSADAVQFAAGQHRLQQIASVHGAVRLARTHDGVQLIDEEDNLAFGLFDLVQHALQALLELAAVLSARDQRTHVQAEHGAVLQVFRHITLDDTLGQALSNGGFTDTGFTDQYRVVLALTAQDADDVTDFGITADDGVKLVGLGHLDQILAVFLQRIVGVLGVIAGHTLVAAHRT